jgi:hypothetical protein
MKFPTAKERREMTGNNSKKENGSPLKFSVLAKRFVEEKVLSEILETKQSSCVNIAVPVEAYNDLDKFVEECRKIIPSDYVVERSHDGCGMYDTLFVCW